MVEVLLGFLQVLGLRLQAVAAGKAAHLHRPALITRAETTDLKKSLTIARAELLLHAHPFNDVNQ